MFFFGIEKPVFQNAHRSADSEGSGYLFFGGLLGVFIKIFELGFELCTKNVHSVIEYNFYIVKFTVDGTCKPFNIGLRTFKKTQLFGKNINDPVNAFLIDLV